MDISKMIWPGTGYDYVKTYQFNYDGLNPTVHEPNRG
jgi:hypothetical protein